jgi:hypothetical protein
MKTIVRALALATVLASAASAAAQATPPADTTTLQFHGFRAGARIDEINGVLRRFDGEPLRCKRAQSDRRVSECRAAVQLADLGGAVDLWVSAIDSVAGVMTISGYGSGGQVDRWRRALQRKYGNVGAKVQGSQWMMQWVNQGRMLRLTWRTDRNDKPVSVSLVDGPVLDGWGRDRAKKARHP